MLGGYIRREEEYLYRTIGCVDQVGAIDDMIKNFLPSFLPSSGTTGVEQEQRSGRFDLTNTW
jgi:hypothetical protein